MDEHPEVVVIGAGQGGLAVSYLLKQSRVPHVVDLRSRVLADDHPGDRSDGS